MNLNRSWTDDFFDDFDVMTLPADMFQNWNSGLDIATAKPVDEGFSICPSKFYVPSLTETKACLMATEIEPEIVVAIDFGTTFSGFAYSFRKDRSSVETGKLLLGEDRVPTVVLLKPDKTVDSLGSKAEDEYAKLVLRKRQKDYRLFSRFKMALHEIEYLTLDSTIKDESDMPMSALELFTIVIRYMKENALDTVKGSLLGDKDNIKDSILWILTIPAIWSDSARQFMHEVFMRAGIPERQFRLVLEPEAAAMYCRNDLLFRSEKHEISNLPKGSKYILADLGGGTVDICSHGIIENNRIQEIHHPTGGAYGGKFVNDEFNMILVDIFGEDLFKKFKKEQFYDYLTLTNEFEKCKRNFDQEENGGINEVITSIPNSLKSLFEETRSLTIEDTVKKKSYSEKVEFVDGKLILKSKMMEQIFSKSVQGITSSLEEIINQRKDQNIKSLLLVGGYAESKYVTGKIKKSMGKKVDVIVVAEPRLSVMKGAVLLGYEDRKIIERRSRVTYGFQVARPFIEGVHPEKYKFERDGKYLCDKIFDKLIEKDQYVKYGQEFKTTTSTPRRYQESKTQTVSINVVTSQKCDPTYCSEEEECKEVGEIKIKPPEGGWPDENKHEMYLTVQEDIMICKVIDNSCGGKEYTTQVDFLSKSLKL